MTRPAPAFVDLRSDTVTRPCQAMRRAMAEAPVGDDVFGEDPTVNALQERGADLLGTEAALFVPSGTMANQIAIKVHTQPGDEILLGHDAHNWLLETGGAAAISGVQATVIGTDGTFTGDDVRAACKPDNQHYTPTRMVSIENTHNFAGGVVWDRARHDDAIAAAKQLGLTTHLDGARLWNAAVATGTAERDLARDFDTISVCLSKGLGAPVGSLLCGSRERLHHAHRVRKMLGGGMRQAGILAAAALFALDNNRVRLADDHANAAYLARELSALPQLRVDADRVHTNIVMIDLASEVGLAVDLEQRASARGLRFVSVGHRRIRLVTHFDVSRDDCTRAIETLAELTREAA